VLVHLVGAPFVTTLPVAMYTASLGYELQIASVTALVLMAPGAVLLLVLERFLKSDYLVFFGQLRAPSPDPTRAGRRSAPAPR
jgi:putative spermidine/putrescine transport system permease protein